MSFSVDDIVKDLDGRKAKKIASSLPQKNDDTICFVEKNELVRKCPKTHENLLQRGLTVRDMYITLGLINDANKLPLKAKKVSIYDINMTLIESVINNIQEIMMSHHKFETLATTIPEEGLYLTEESSNSEEKSEDDDESFDGELEFSDQRGKSKL